MESYRRYQAQRSANEGARSVLGKIGRPQRTTAKGEGHLHGLRVQATIYHQETDGAANYHENPVLDAALSEAALKLWPQLQEIAESILREREQQALLACRGDLERALEEVKSLESAA